MDGWTRSNSNSSWKITDGISQQSNIYSRNIKRLRWTFTHTRTPFNRLRKLQFRSMRPNNSRRRRSTNINDINFYMFICITGAPKKNFSRAEATVAEINLIVQQTDHRIQSWIYRGIYQHRIYMRHATGTRCFDQFDVIILMLLKMYKMKCILILLMFYCEEY